MPTVRRYNGFTLVELIVVVSITSLMGVFAMVNIGSFRKEQELTSAASDIQSAIRLAQTNATNSVKCNGMASVPWSIELKDKNTINLVCSNQSTPVALKSTVQISDIKGTTSCSIYPVVISFSALYGDISFTPSLGDGCISPLTTQSLEISLTNDSGTRKVMINKGGSVDVQ